MGKGNYKFKLSDMIPGSWFNKLIGMRSRGRRRSREIQNSVEEKRRVPITEKNKPLSNQNPIPTPPLHQSYNRNRTSYYIPSRDRADKLLCSPPKPKASDTLFPLNTPRKFKSRPQKKPMTSSASTVCTCRKQNSSILTSEPSAAVPLHRLSAGSDDELCVAERYLPLPPIVTKRRSKEFDKPLPVTRNRSSKQGKLLDYSNMRRSPAGTQRIKMRINSPKLLKNRASRQRKALEESFVVMKSPSNPRREFRESMVEMIVHHNLREEKDLEELLACYLTLNSDEYHDLIVKVFKQIWFDLTEFNMQSTRK